MKAILSELVDIAYVELSQAEKNILAILKANGIAWHINDEGIVRPGGKKRK